MDARERERYRQLFAKRPKPLSFPKKEPKLPSFAVPYNNRVWFYLFSPDPYVEGEHHYSVYPSRALKEGERVSIQQLFEETERPIMPTGLIPLLALERDVVIISIQSKEQESWEKQWRRTLRCFFKALAATYRLWMALPEQNWWVVKGNASLPYGIAKAHFEGKHSFYVRWGGGEQFQWVRGLPSPLVEAQLKAAEVELPQALAKSRPFGLDGSIRLLRVRAFKGSGGCGRAEELKR